MNAAQKKGLPVWAWILIAIIGLGVLSVVGMVVLGGVLGAVTYSQLSDARDESVRAQCETIASAAELAYVENGACPTIDDLVRMGSVMSPSDAWGTPFAIECGGGGAITVRSAGVDRQVGTSDDVVVTRGE